MKTASATSMSSSARQRQLQRARAPTSTPPPAAATTSSPAARASDESYLVDASADGRDVFFSTRSALVGWDENENYDIYDAPRRRRLPGTAARRRYAKARPARPLAPRPAREPRARHRQLPGPRQRLQADLLALPQGQGAPQGPLRQEPAQQSPAAKTRAPQSERQGEGRAMRAAKGIGSAARRDGPHAPSLAPQALAVPCRAGLEHPVAGDADQLQPGR